MQQLAAQGAGHGADQEDQGDRTCVRSILAVIFAPGAWLSAGARAGGR
jgi:hypothetical protein